MYNDIPYIAETLKVTVPKLYMLSNNNKQRRKHRDNKYENYHTVIIHKGRGHKNRVLSVPNALLKSVQKRILESYLYDLSPSDYSTAYCKGKSLLDNASPHVGKECVLKLDISHFFDSINDDMVFLVMKQLKMSVTATALFTHLCTYKNKLPQGAPTSPHIANLVMKQFDEKLGKWCKGHDITYTRYCDDMTFSGTKENVRRADVIKKVRGMLYHMGFFLNDKKIVFINSSQQQRVTGIVVNEKPVVSRKQRRCIRQEVYYLKKYGATDCIRHKELDISPEKYLRSLLGRISFAMQIEPDNTEMAEYSDVVRKMLDSDTPQSRKDI